MLQRRRINRETNASIAELRRQISQMRNESELKDEKIQVLEIEMKRLENENAEKRSKMKENDLWFAETYKYCPAATKKVFRNAYQLAASSNEIPTGTTLRLLRNTGINLAKRLPKNGEEKSDLKKKVEKFAEENSSEMPDMRHQRRGVRFRHHYLITLYDEFKHCYPETEISYFTFSS